jgi:hypothetical protein
VPVTPGQGRGGMRRWRAPVGVALGTGLLALAAMQAWRWADGRSADAAWTQLRASAPVEVAPFEPAMVEALPEAARRYFLFAIAEGTPLRRVAELRMDGEIGLGDRAAPGYQPMRARQILAAPHGFVWRLDGAGRGLVRMSGSDGMAGPRSWTRFWLAWTAPVARMGGGEDHLRASFGRAVAEAVFWAPAAMLPGEDVVWEEGDAPDRARAVVTHGGLRQEVEIEVAEDGRLRSVVFPRWTDANPEREWRLQPFGGRLAAFRTFQGFTIPTEVEAGNMFGTPDYFPFFRARIVEARFF